MNTLEDEGMNFEFLNNLNDFKQLAKFCSDAEDLVFDKPDLSAASSRKALESIIKSFYVAKYGYYNSTSSLFELIDDPYFSAYLDEPLLSSMHFVRKIGNNGAHGEEVTKKQAVSCLHALHDSVVGILKFLGVIEEANAFKASFYDAKPVVSEPVNPKAIEEEVEIDKKALSKYKESIDESITLKATQDITEAETRKLYIDEALKEAGWKIHDKDNVVVSGLACTEIVLEGMPNPSDEGRADYILFDDDGMPLAVVEAKRTSVDPVKGYHQAELYADAIENKWGRRPVIFTTNGYTINIVDTQGYPERKIFGFYSKAELKYLLAKKQDNNIIHAHIDQTISDRPFIQEAVTAVCEAFNKKRRKALVVMATGTGKTRFAISLVDVMNKYSWAKRVLFLADRTALVNQAKANFSKYLPSNTICVLSDENESERDYNAQVTLSTYQTMINTIDGDNRKYGVAHFDLIILDECHRSIYNKYRAIFTYFDSLLLGLTATPKEYDELLTTYDVFDLPKGEPTYSYDYETAVKERFLVDFHVFDRTTNLLKNGLRHSDLSESEKEQYEKLFGDEDGLFPKEIDHDEFYRRVLNNNTIDIVLNTIMTEGLRVKNGEALGKTIIFAVKHEHAMRIVERFNILYPEKGPNFCKLVDNYVNYAQNLISEFQIPDNDFRIAVSVDMMDTGVDVQEVTNLVFFKRVFSKIKFWQMIGRGTRVRPELNVLSPCRDWFEKKTEESEPQVYEDKQGFYIFDFCDVFEFFGAHPEGRTPKQALNVSQKIFETKVDLVLELQKAEHQENEEHLEFYQKYKSEILKTIKGFNRKLINVKASLKYVDKFSLEKTWEYITIVDVKEIKKYLTPLIEPDSMEEKSKLFDLWLLNMELEEIIGEKDYSKAISKVTNIAGALLEKQTIPQVKAKKDFLGEIITEDFWNSISITKLEKIRTELRDLIQYLDRKYVESVSSKFVDSLIIKKGGVGTIKPSFKNYKQRVIDYLSDNVEIGAIYKIRNLIPLDEDDLEELEHLLCDELGTKQDYDELAKGLAFGPFVRTIVGLEVEAVEKLLNEYLSKYNFNSKQQDFLRTIVSYVLQNGDITISDLFNHKPFMSTDYTKLFNGDTMPVYNLINTLHSAVCLA